MLSYQIKTLPQLLKITEFNVCIFNTTVKVTEMESE